MQYRTLGSTGLNVSEIGFGGAQVGVRDLPEGRAQETLEAVLEAGINFIDTAALYGLSEARIGKYLSHRKDEFILATKCGDYDEIVDGERVIHVDLSPAGIERIVDESRKKLRMDTIDIVQFHSLPQEEDEGKAAFDTLFDIKSKGWVRFVGVSADGQTGESVAEAWPLDTHEFTYNVLYQEAAEDLLPTLRNLGRGTIIKRPIANAVWRIAEEPDEDYMGLPWKRAQQMPLDELAGDMDLVEFALRFTLAHPDVCTAIVGSTNPDNIRDNVRISDGVDLPRFAQQRAKAAFREHFA